MLRKLLKQEFRATGRIGLPLCIAMIAISVLAAFALPQVEGTGDGFVKTVSTIIMILYGLGIFALVIGILVVIINRFYRSVLHDEGYLSMTLPVSLHKLLTAKLICALLWYIIGLVILFAAALLLGLTQIDWVAFIGGFADFFRAAWRELPELSGIDVLWFVTLGLEMILCVALACLQTTLHFYASMAVGHAFTRRKLLLSVIAFFAMSIIYSMLIFRADFMLGFGSVLWEFVSEGHWALHLTLGVGAVIVLITDAVLYVITWLCLKFRLNLE